MNPANYHRWLAKYDQLIAAERERLRGDYDHQRHLSRLLLGDEPPQDVDEATAEAIFRLAKVGFLTIVNHLAQQKLDE